MARPGLMRHRKFARLSRLVGSAALARGHLEMVWDVAYENGDAFLGDAGDLEHLAGWQGAPGALAAALVESGFVDLDSDGYRVHDLFDHAPDYVRKRRQRERERQAKGAEIDPKASPVQSVTGQCPPNGRPLAPAPAPAPAPALEAGGEAAPSPVVAVLPCIGNGAHDYAVTQAEVDKWQEAFPGLDVKAEVLRAKAWLYANPDCLKPQSRIPRFLVSWFGRSKDRPERKGKPSATAPAEKHTVTGRVAL